MLTRVGHYFLARDEESAPMESRYLERDGYCVVKQAFTPQQVTELKVDINRIFREEHRNGGIRSGPVNDDDMFRYGMLNRSAVCYEAIKNQNILRIIEPLIGEDCHVIANTAWRNPAGHSSSTGQGWHIDAGPHVPLPEGLSWPSSIPHPVFAIGVHIFLQDCRKEDGPTGVIPGSHLSGRFPPEEREMDDYLTYEDRHADLILGKAGDVGMFVSDIWHRRMPATKDDQGRFFLQVHYGRRDIAQRIQPTAVVNHLSAEVKNWAVKERDRTLVGLHQKNFYDG